MNTDAITNLLEAWRNGDSDAARNLVPLVYQELRVIARRQLGGNRTETLRTTALVHEAYLKLGRRSAACRRGPPSFLCDRRQGDAATDRRSCAATDRRKARRSGSSRVARGCRRANRGQGWRNRRLERGVGSTERCRRMARSRCRAQILRGPVGRRDSRRARLLAPHHQARLAKGSGLPASRAVRRLTRRAQYSEWPLEMKVGVESHAAH